MDDLEVGVRPAWVLISLRWISTHPHKDSVCLCFPSLYAHLSLSTALPRRPQLPALDPEKNTFHRLLNHSYNYKRPNHCNHQTPICLLQVLLFWANSDIAGKWPSYAQSPYLYRLSTDELFMVSQPEKKSREDSDKTLDSMDSFLHLPSWFRQGQEVHQSLRLIATFCG